MRYPIAIETGDAKHAYGVVVPDLPGCFSAGDTLDQAIANTEEAILLHMEDIVDSGHAPPPATKIETLRRRRQFKGMTWAIVDADLGKLNTKAVRLNITLPDRLLHSIDRYARRHGESRSGFLARAAMQAMSAD
jgi:predicted RNase H-like HicB family nuclease